MFRVSRAARRARAIVSASNSDRRARGLRRAAVLVMCAMPALANQPMLDGTSIAQVSVNGGTDTANTGTSCIKVTSPVSATCPSGWVAIPNNNKLLLATALQAKALGVQIWFYYDDAGPSFHCPGHTFTPCSVVSISIK
jgi:hypothetical protein